MVAAKLQQLRVNKDYINGSGLLVAFLDPTGESQASMENIGCNSCGKKGHVVRFFNSLPWQGKLIRFFLG